MIPQRSFETQVALYDSRVLCTSRRPDPGIDRGQVFISRFAQVADPTGDKIKSFIGCAQFRHYVGINFGTLIIPSRPKARLQVYVRCSIQHCRGNIIGSIIDRNLIMWRIPGQIKSESKVNGKIFIDRFFQRQVDIRVALSVIMIITEHMYFHFGSVTQSVAGWLQVMHSYPSIPRCKPLLQRV